MFAVRCHSSVDQALFPCTLFVCPLSDPVSRPRCSSALPCDRSGLSLYSSYAHCA